MRCVKCRRVTLKPARVVETANGPEGWGPTCARRAGLLGGERRCGPRTKPTPTSVDTQQMELPL